MDLPLIIIIFKRQAGMLHYFPDGTNLCKPYVEYRYEGVLFDNSAIFTGIQPAEGTSVKG